MKWFASNSVEQTPLVSDSPKSHVPDDVFLLHTAELEQQVKETFSVNKDTECRVWHRYMTNTYELLSNSSQTLQDAGLYNGQVSKGNREGDRC